MLKLLNRKTLFLPVFISFICSCGLFSFETLEVTFNVTEMNQVVIDDDEFRAKFSMDVVREEAEKAFKLESPSKTIEGDFSWQGNMLVFSPIVELKTGIRYKISVRGDIRLHDSRIFNLNEILPFYFMTNEDPPVLVSWSPLPDNPISAYGDLSFTFSRGIDEESFIDNFSLNPDIDFTHTLSADSMTIILTPEEEWKNLEKHSWTISSDYTDVRGISPVEYFSDSFFVVEDIEAPGLVRIIPVYNIDLEGSDPLFQERSAVPGEEPLDFLQYKDCILLEFTEEIDFTVLQESAAITPHIPGMWLDFSETEFCFIPETGWDMSTEYTLSISEKLTDLYGNIFYMDDPLVFTPDIAEFTISTFVISESSGAVTLAVQDLDPDIPVDIHFRLAGLEGSDPLDIHQFFTVIFNQPVEGSEQKQEVINALIPAWSSPFGSGDSPSIFIVSWTSDTEVHITWAGFEEYISNKDVYYLFKVDSGPNTIRLNNGSYIKDDIEILFYYAGVDN